MAKISNDEIARVKALGFLHDKNTEDKFNGRVITRNGKITAEECAAISEGAKKFGSGQITLTSRMTMEIQGVPFENIQPLIDFMAEHNLDMGGTTAAVRPIVSCKGTTCKFGLIDTFSVSQEIHERFFQGYKDVRFPHKFKIAVGGCPNSCVKPDLNDVGIIGQRVPTVDTSKCRGCRICQIEKACPIKASKVVDGKVSFDEEKCNHCGRCMNKCPFKAYDNYTNGYKIFIGGRWGKLTAKAHTLSKIFTDREEVMEIVEKALLLFKDQGIKGERFADTIERLGFENVETQLFSDDLLKRKEEIIAKEVNE
ncbi:MAG: 4Fe-4S dicluster domain-containing protein [Oscillospiraceae bacterium]